MAYPRYILELFFILAAVSTLNGIDPPLQVDVYYESLCPDSKNFVTTQLYPAWKKLGHHFNVGLKPFGKASATPTQTLHPGWNFECQHGLIECIGNVYQSCFLNFEELYHAQRLEVVNCVMSDEKSNAAVLKCMDEQGIDKALQEDVYECATSYHGQDLLHEMGDQTHALEPALSFVPWVTFNGEWSKNWQDGSIEDFEKVLCENFLQSVPECEQK